MDNVFLFFNGVEKECTVEIDRNGELLCTAIDGDEFAKFVNDEDFEFFVNKHNEANNLVVEEIPEIIYENQVHRDEDGNEIVA